MKAVIGGCGRVGARLAEMLSMDRHEVTVIDVDNRAFERLSKVFRGEVEQGEAFDGETLEKSGIGEAGIFVAVTNYDNTNLMAMEVAEHIYHVPRAVARLYNPDKEQTYRPLGIEYVCGTREVAREIMEKVFRPAVRLRGQCANNAAMIVEFDPPPAWAGKPLSRFAGDYEMETAWVRRDGKALFPEEGFRGREGDMITAMVSEEGLRRLERKLTGKRG